ncbi:Endo-1,4-beta-xylanase A precursor [compost metagenome]
MTRIGKRLSCGVLSLFIVLGSVQLAPVETAKAAESSTIDNGQYARYGVVDIVDLGNEASEQEHKLAGSGSQSVIGAEGETARVSLPKSTPDYLGGDITFTVKVDPDAQNYFTLKLWGSDASEYRCFLAIGNQVLYPSPLVIAKMAEEPAIENRFVYSTVPIPLEQTKGKTELTVTLRTVAAYYPYSAGTFSLAYQEKVIHPSNKYYAGYVHTTASLSDEVIQATGTAPLVIPPVRDNGENGSDLDPDSVSAKNMQAHIAGEITSLLKGVVDRDASTSQFTTATWSSPMTNNTHGSGTMMPPYSQNDVNPYNLSTVSKVLLETDSEEYDAAIKQVGVDHLLNALLHASDRVIINYLNKPGSIQVGGHQSSWGGFYQGLGESLWNVNLLFAEGRYKELGGQQYNSFDEWFNGSQLINWKDRYSTVANFYHQPEADKPYPFLMTKTADQVGEQPYITTRKAAYEELLWLNYSYARTHAYTLTPLTNQVMFQMYGAFRSNAGLIAMHSDLAENYKSSLRQLFRSSGVLPYYDIDVVNGTVEAEMTNAGTYTGEMIIKNIEAFNSNTQFDQDRNYIGDYRKAWGLNYYLVTSAGLTRETTYAAGYGEHSDLLVHAWRMVKDAAEIYKDTPGTKLADENELLRKALQAINARSHMRYQDVDEGYRSMRLEATIEARGPFYPYDAGYLAKLSPTGTTTIEPLLLPYLKAEIEKDPNKYKQYFGADYDKLYGYATDAVAYTQQMLADNQLTPAINRSFTADLKSLASYKYVISQPRIPKLMPSTNLDWYSDDELSQLEKLGFDKDEMINNSFYDIEDSIVQFRDEDTVYSLELEYKSDSGLTGLSRIHATSSTFDKIAMVKTEIHYTPSGFWNYTVPLTTVMYNLSYDPVTGIPDGSTNLLGGSLLPVASWKGYDQINLTHSKSGSPFGGYAEFYSVQYGKYMIAMNTTRDSYDNSRNYDLILPSTFKGSIIYDKLSNKWLTVRNGKVSVPPYSAVVLDLEDDAIVNDIPLAPAFATGVASDNMVALTWMHSGGTDKAYEILRSNAAEGSYSVIASIDKDINLFIDDTAAAGQTYYYKVRGVSSKDRRGNPSPYAKVTVSPNKLTDNWSFDTTAWGLDKTIGTITDLQAAMKEGTVTFTGNRDSSGNLLFAYTSNLLKEHNGEVAQAPTNGNFEMTAKIESGQEIGIMFKESLDVKSRGGYLTLDPEGNYQFVYRQQPNTIKDDDMRLDGYHIFNNLNPLPVTGHVDGAKWIKVLRDGLYIYAYVSTDGIEWEPIGSAGYPLYPSASASGESYFLDNDWNLMKVPGEFYMPMADTLYVGIASSGEGEASHVSLLDNGSIEGTLRQVDASIASDNVNGLISLSWKQVLQAAYYNVYRTQDAAVVEGNPVEDDRWDLVGEKIMDTVFTDDSFKIGSDGPVYYKVVAFDANDRAGTPSKLLTGEIDIEGIEFPTSVWKSLDTNTPSVGYDQMSDSTLSIFSDGKRIWNTDGNSYRFVYQSIPAQTDGTYIARVDKSAIIGEHLGEGLLVRNNVKSQYDGSTYHRSVRINSTKGIFAEGQQSLSSSRYSTDNTGANQDAWLRLDTHSGSENIDVYYAPATGAETAYPENWTKILTFSPDNSLTSTNWRNMDSGTDGQWFVGFALATGGVMTGSNFYNVAPIFDIPKVEINGEEKESSKNITVQQGTPIRLHVSAKDAFGVNTLPARDIELASSLPDGATFDAATGELNWTPQSAGAYTLSFKMQDKGSLNDFYGGLDIKVNVLANTVIPVFESIPDSTHVAGKAFELNVKASVKDVATGSDGSVQEGLIKYDIKSIVDSAGESHSADDLGIAFNKVTGHFKWTPDKLQTGIYSITFQATDGEFIAETTVALTIIGAPLFQISGKYKEDIEAGRTITLTAEEKLLLPIAINDPTGRAYYNYVESIPEGATYTSNTLSWTPSYKQGESNGTYTLKLVAYNANFKNELTVHFKVAPAAIAAPHFTQDWRASALSSDSLVNLKATIGGLGNEEISINNSSHKVNTSYNQGTGRSSFIYQKLDSNAEIQARITGYNPASKFAGIMISDYYGPDSASTGINKAADTVLMALSATEYSTANTQSGRYKTDSVLAFVRNNDPTNGDYPNLGYATGETDATQTYWVKMTYTVNSDGTATVQGFYKIDGASDWTTNTDWKFTYSKAQVTKGLYGGIMASPCNNLVTFDNAKITQEITPVVTYSDELLQITTPAQHSYEQVLYSYEMEKDGLPYSSNAVIGSTGVFNWIPDETGTYDLTLIATAATSGERAVKKYSVVVYTIDKTVLQNLVDSVQDYYQLDYTESSWSSFSAALDSAKTVLLNVYATQPEIDSAASDLSAAAQALINAKLILVSKDAYIHGGSPASNYGVTTSMIVLRTSAGVQRMGLVNFDISKLAGKDLSSAELKLYSSTSNSARLYPMVASVLDYNDWSESAVSYNTLTARFPSVTSATYLAEFVASLPGITMPISTGQSDTGAYGAWKGDIRDLVQTAINNGNTNLTLLLTVRPETTNEVNPATREFSASGIPAGTYSPSITVDFDMTIQDLRDILNKVESSYVPGNYTADSWTPMTAAVDQATTVTEATYASQNDINTAYEAFRPAFLGLVSIEELNGLIARAEALAEGDYTASSWASLKSALSDASAVQHNPSAAKTEVKAATTSLKAALEALVSVRDLRELTVLYGSYNNNDGNYTKTSWNSAQAALAAALGLLQDNDPTGKELQAAYVRLKSAFESLDDASALRDQVTAITEKYTKESYTAASWNKMESALNNAVDMLFDGDATSLELANALDDLTESERNLVSITGLKQAVDLARNIVNDGAYTDLTWGTFTQRRDAAIQLLSQASDSSITITKSKVTTTVNALAAAQAALLTRLDLEQLSGILSRAENLDGSPYTTASWNTLQAAVEQARIVQSRGAEGDELLTQAEVDTAATNLEAAIAALETKPDPGTDPDDGNSNGNNGGNNGGNNSGDSDGNNNGSSGGTTSNETSMIGSGNKQFVTDSDWSAMTNGVLAIQVGSGVTDVVLPVDASERLGSGKIRITTDKGVVIEIPSSVLKELAQLGTAGNGTIIIRIDRAPADGQAAVKSSQGGFKPASPVYEFSLIRVTSTGAEQTLERTSEPVIVTLPIDTEEADPELTGVYHYRNLGGEWEYVGGTANAAAKIITVKAYSFSPYAALEYQKSFADMPVSHWASRALEVMVSKHVINGVTDTAFVPNGQTTRAEFVAMLVRMFGIKAKGSVQFSDVESGAWYEDEVAAAYETGLVTGVTGDSFMPNRQITREEMAVLAVRAFEYAKGKSQGQQSLSGYSDADQVSAWAKSGVATAVSLGLMQGSGGSFAPARKTTRAETVQLMYNLFQILR